MDAALARRIIAESKRDIDNRTCDQLYEYLNFIDTVIAEKKKTESFKSRMMFICMANRFPEVNFRVDLISRMAFSDISTGLNFVNNGYEKILRRLIYAKEE